MTRERAEQYARSQIAQMKAHGYEDPSPETFAAIVDDLFRDGDAPDTIVTGYEWKPRRRVVFTGVPAAPSLPTPLWPAIRNARRPISVLRNFETPP